MLTFSVFPNGPDRRFLDTPSELIEIALRYHHSEAVYDLCTLISRFRPQGYAGICSETLHARLILTGSLHECSSHVVQMGQAGKATIVTALGKGGPLATLDVYQKDETML